mmetsp:Transcript_9498/g.15565  ORF Transcript_9498/g.15565 Transcript_9498/m.15565 type:complete len:96 (+) Transcript_9498:444-731(+)
MIFFVLCGVGRLARYNVTAEFISGDTGKVKYYEGMPIPGSLLIVIMLFIAWYTDATHDDIWGGKLEVYPGHFHPLSLVYLVMGVLMVSLVRIPKP